MKHRQHPSSFVKHNVYFVPLQDKVKGEIKLKNINFNYPVRPNVKVLCDLSITVPAGKTLALVGESGSGKSTIFTLIERFYSPISGAISLDGVDYKDMNIRWLRSKIGIVSQEPVLFDMSIGDNIRYGTGNRNVTDKEIIQVAKAANIHEFISSLPQVIKSRLPWFFIRAKVHI